MKISLRGRVTLWYVLTIPILIFGVTFAAQRVLVTNMRSDLDDGLRDRAEIVANTIITASALSGLGYTDVAQQLDRQQLPLVPIFLRVSDPGGKSLASFGDIPAPIIPLLDRLWVLPDDPEGQFYNVEVGRKAPLQGIRVLEHNEGELRVYTVAVRDPSTEKPVILVQTGESLANLADAEERLWQLALSVGAVGSILILAVGVFILHRGFSSMERILSRVREIGRSGLQSGLSNEPRPPELQRLAISLNDMWRRLDDAIRARESFLANVSHELRTPLTALQGQIDVLLMQPSTDREGRNRLLMMGREVHRLVRMTNDLLLNAELDSAPSIVFETVSLQKLLEEVAGEACSLAEGLDIGLQITSDSLVSGDYDLLKQMMLNVVDNAIKFTPRGGHIELSLHQPEGWAVIEVSDTGVGIPAEDLPHVTEAFYKGRSTGKPIRRGLGLGLSIVSRIVQVHNGKLEIQSQGMGGTTVKILVPLLTGAGRGIVSEQLSGQAVR